MPDIGKFPDGGGHPMVRQDIFQYIIEFFHCAIQVHGEDKPSAGFKNPGTFRYNLFQVFHIVQPIVADDKINAIDLASISQSHGQLNQRKPCAETNIEPGIIGVETCGIRSCQFKMHCLRY